MTDDKESHLLIGWASRDITPDRPVLLRGQFYARVSEGVMDPITVTALALESVQDGEPDGRSIMVSCDLVCISACLHDAVCAQVCKDLPELDPKDVCINAIHTHSAPDNRVERTEALQAIGTLPLDRGLGAQDLGVMDAAEYSALAVARIADAVSEAWKSRSPGGIGFGLGHAVAGLNRRASYFSGETRMYGKTNDSDFSHMEGGVDHSVNLLCTWNEEQKLTGMVVNLACPSQISEHEFRISADYWHETRVELRQRLGDDLYVLPQCSAAGDQSPHVQICKPAEERMLRLAGRTQRQDLAVRISDAVTATIPLVEKEINWNPAFAHRVETLHLPLRKLTEEDVEEASVIADEAQSRYEALVNELKANPEMKKEPRWYVDVTTAYNQMLWNQGVARRFELQQTQPCLPVAVHILRLGDMVIATNPYELYLDHGLQIKARSKAIQTFVVQLAGPGTYLPTVRATEGKSYGAVPASTPIGPEGGRLLVEKTLEGISQVFEEEG